MRTFHAHDLVTFTHCRRKDYYHRMRGWEVPTLGRNVEVGSMFHAGLAEYYRGGNPIDGTSRYYEKTNVIAQEDFDLACDMLNFYIENFAKLDKIAEVLSVEQELIYPVVPGVFQIICRPDLVFRDMSGCVRLRDHKSKDVLPSDYTWFDMDLQMMVYQLVIREYGWAPAVVEHNLVRREVPPGFGHRPEYNEGIDKNGKAYRRKSTASTNPQDYVRMYSFQKSSGTLDAYDLEVQRIVQEMSKASPLRSPGPLCSYCPYLVPCLRELAGETVSDEEASQLFTLQQTV